MDAALNGLLAIGAIGGLFCGMLAYLNETAWVLVLVLVSTAVFCIAGVIKAKKTKIFSIFAVVFGLVFMLAAGYCYFAWRRLEAKATDKSKNDVGKRTEDLGGEAQPNSPDKANERIGIRVRPHTSAPLFGKELVLKVDSVQVSRTRLVRATVWSPGYGLFRIGPASEGASFRYQGKSSYDILIGEVSRKWVSFVVVRHPRSAN